MTDKTNILLLDDRRESPEALRAVLERLPQSLIEAESGREAQQERTRQTPMMCQPPIMFLSAVFRSAENLARGYVAGAARVKEEPETFDRSVTRDLREALRELGPPDQPDHRAVGGLPRPGGGSWERAAHG